MPRPLFAVFSVCSFLVLLTIHSCCFTVACDLTEPSLQLRLMRNGKNALFGPDAFIPVDSVRLSTLDPLQPDPDLHVFETDEILEFTVRKGEQYLLEIPGILADTFTVSTVEDTKGCCNSTRLVEARRNGEVICTDDCEMVLEIEI